MCNGNCGSCAYTAKPWSDSPRICMDPDSPKYMKACEDESNDRRMETTNEYASTNCSNCD